MCAWRLGHNGEPAAESVGSIPQELDPALRAELTGFLRVHGDRWVPVGPCLDGGWYACPLQDRGGPRVHGATLAELSRNIHAREHGQ
jgi:hypothetical protein